MFPGGACTYVHLSWQKDFPAKGVGLRDAGGGCSGIFISLGPHAHFLGQHAQ